jgi:hypothetical protein
MGVEYRQGLAGHQFAGGAAEVADRRQAIVRSADGKLGRPRKLPPLWHRRCTPGVRFEYQRISNGDQFGWGTVTIVNSIPRSPHQARTAGSNPPLGVLPQTSPNLTNHRAAGRWDRRIQHGGRRPAGTSVFGIGSAVYKPNDTPKIVIVTALALLAETKVP